MTETDAHAELPLVLIALFKGVVYRDAQETTWQQLLALQNRVRDYVRLLALDLELDETEGYAYLRQVEADADGEDVPRLVARRQLSYLTSLLLALLRKKLAEHDAGSAEARLILSQQDMVEQVRLFLPDTANEVKLVDKVQTHINQVVKLGFLRKLRGQDDRYEVRRILQSFVDAQWLGEFNQRLAEYREQDA